MGTGKVVHIEKLKIDQQTKFRGFQYHNTWNGFNMICNKDRWMKVLIKKTSVEIECDFLYQAQLGSKIYVSSTNQLALEFKSECSSVIVSELLRDFAKNPDLNIAKPLTVLKPSCPCVASPIYFTPDFTAYLDYKEHSKFLSLYQLPKTTDSKHFLKKEYQRFQLSSFVPDLSNVQRENVKSGLYMIEFYDKTRLRYVNKYWVEQIIYIEDGAILMEKYHQQKQLKSFFNKRLVDYLQQTRELQKLNEEEIFKVKAEAYHNQSIATCSDNMMTLDPAQNTSFISIPNNLRCFSSITYVKWKIQEKLASGDLSLAQLLTTLKKDKLSKLLHSSLPTGGSLLHTLVSANCLDLDKFFNHIEEKHLDLKILPDLKGVTPLHLCIRDLQITIASSILKVLSGKPLDDHSNFIKDLMPDLLKLCPLALADYLDQRLMKVPWALQFTDGKLNTQAGCDFAVSPLQLCPTNDQDLRRALFDESEKLYTDVKLPLNLYIADVPDLHQFGNETGRSFLKQLSMVKHSGTLFSKKYVQALVETKWVPIREAIMTQIFIPYLIYLGLYNFYGLYLIYERQNDFILEVATYVVQILICILTIHSFYYEVREYRSQPEFYKFNIWNYLDIVPKFLVLLCIVLDLTSFLSGIEQNDIKNFVVSLNAVSMFCLWINILNFLRLFRNTGYLIHLIIQVIMDMRYFVALVCVTLLSFSGAFYILSRSNKGKGDFVDSSYIQANAFIYQLLLGQFDPSEFGPENLGLTWLLFVLATLFLIVVMLNLLISIISATFSAVQAEAKQRMYSEFAQLIVENYHLLSKSRMKELDTRGRYLYLAWLEEHTEQRESEVLIQKMKEMLNVHKREIKGIIEQKFAQVVESQKDKKK